MAAKRYLIVGLGRFGTALAEELAAQGADVLAVDRDMRHVDALKEKVGLAAQLDATDTEALRGIEAQGVTAAVVAIGESFEASVLCVAALREAGAGRIIARARTAMQARILLAVGASQVIEIESEMGRRLGQTLAVTEDAGLSNTRAFATATRKQS